MYQLSIVMKHPPNINCDETSRFPCSTNAVFYSSTSQGDISHYYHNLSQLITILLNCGCHHWKSQLHNYDPKCYVAAFWLLYFFVNWEEKYIIWSNEQDRNPNITKIIWLTKCHVSQYSGCHVLLLEAQHLLWARFEYYFIRLQIFLINMYRSHYNIHLVIMCRNVLDILLLWVHGGSLQHGLPLHLLLGLPPR